MTEVTVKFIFPDEAGVDAVQISQLIDELEMLMPFGEVELIGVNTVE